MGINSSLSERKWGVTDPISGYQLQQKRGSRTGREPRSAEGTQSSQARTLS